MTSAPWTFEDARAKCVRASRKQEAAEEHLRESAREAAEAEEAYRRALAEEIIAANARGVAWSVCAELARGDKRVAELRRKRDIAEGVREAMVQAAWRRAADRKDAQRFSEWSMRRELAEGAGMTPEPQWDKQPTFPK